MEFSKEANDCLKHIGHYNQLDFDKCLRKASETLMFENNDHMTGEVT